MVHTSFQSVTQAYLEKEKKRMPPGMPVALTENLHLPNMKLLLIFQFGRNSVRRYCPDVPIFPCNINT